MSVYDLLGRGGANLQRAIESLVSKSIAIPAQSGQLSGRLPNYFELVVPRKLEKTSGLDVVAELCGKVVMSHVPYGRVAPRFVLLAQTDSSHLGGELLLQVQTLSDEEVRAKVVPESSRIASGLTLLRLYPADLMVVRAGGKEKEFDRAFCFGRAEDNDLVLAMPSVSAHHGQVVCDGTTWELVDLSSSNGTELNGQEVRRSPLATGDQVMVAGQTVFEVAELRPWLVIDGDVAGVVTEVEDEAGVKTVDEHAPTVRLCHDGDTVKRPFV